MRFPYGIADFHKILEGGYFYVDRTDRIPLIEQVGKQLLFLRPRRFGKSLWLSTLESNHPPAEPGAFVHEPLKAAIRGRYRGPFMGTT